MKKLFILVIFAALALSACKKPEQVPNVSNRIFPMAVGNTWTYVDSLVYLVDSVPQETTITSHTWEVMREGYLDEPYGDRRRVKTYKVSYQKDSCEFFVFAHSQESGIVMLGIQAESGTIQLFEGEFVMKYPMTTGEILVPDPMMWFDCFEGINSEVVPLKPDTLVHPGSNSQFISPAGTFTVFDYGNQIWAEDVGLIRLYYRQDVNDANTLLLHTHIRTRTLESYALFP